MSNVDPYLIHCQFFTNIRMKQIKKANKSINCHSFIVYDTPQQRRKRVYASDAVIYYIRTIEVREQD